jgi:hypothetical protein
LLGFHWSIIISIAILQAHIQLRHLASYMFVSSWRWPLCRYVSRLGGMPSQGGGADRASSKRSITLSLLVL